MEPSFLSKCISGKESPPHRLWFDMVLDSGLDTEKLGLYSNAIPLGNLAFAKFILEKRTEKELVEKEGLNPQTVSDWVNGRHKIPHRYWLRLTEETGMGIVELGLYKESVPLRGLALLEYIGSRSLKAFAGEKDIDESTLWRYIHGRRALPKEYLELRLPRTGRKIEEYGPYFSEGIELRNIRSGESIILKSKNGVSIAGKNPPANMRFEVYKDVGGEAIKLGYFSLSVLSSKKTGTDTVFLGMFLLMMRKGYLWRKAGFIGK